MTDLLWLIQCPIFFLLGYLLGSRRTEKRRVSAEPTKAQPQKPLPEAIRRICRETASFLNYDGSVQPEIREELF